VVVAGERYEGARVLVTVKTYPNPSATYEETVCTAGVRVDLAEPAWIRLYPVRFRNIEQGVQVGKYELIDIAVAKHPNDPRPESFRPNQQAIDPDRERVSIPAGGAWPGRRELLGDLIGQVTTCDLITANRAVRMNEPAAGVVIDRTVKKQNGWLSPDENA
jgi:hypothetical protein